MHKGLAQRTLPLLLAVLGGGLLILFAWAFDLLADAAAGDSLLVLREKLFFAAVLLFAIGALAMYFALRAMARPIEEAAEAAARIAGGKVRERMPPGESREQAQIAAAVNQLARKLGDRKARAARPDQHQEAVLSSMAEGVVALNGDGRIITLNAAAARLFNMEGVRHKGKGLAEVIRNPDVLRFAESAAGEDTGQEQEVALGAGRARRIIRLAGTPLLDRRKKRIGTLLMLADVTRVRGLESIRREFVANVSHELKTPITAIQGAVETLRDGAAAKKADRDKFLDILQRQSQRLAALVSDTLSLSRIEQDLEKGGITLKEKPLLPVLERAVSDCEGVVQERAVTVTLDCDPALKTPIDPPLLEQAVVNLLHNAATYSRKGGTVRIAAEPGKGEIVLSVTDKGKGIAPEHHARLFERFYRVDPARSRQLGGTGLGLAIVKHAAIAHGGRVSVTSSPGKGATFRMHLPAA